MFKLPEQYRKKSGPMASDSSHENNGMCEIHRGRTTLFAMCSDGMGWQHVSVSCISEGKDRTPTWAEMCYIKDLFWTKDECVIQYHPAESEYINMHKHCLHLWKPIGITLPIPNKIMVGISI